MAPSVIWELFFGNRSKYKTDQTHNNAWCLACLLPEVLICKPELVDPETKDVKQYYWNGTKLRDLKEEVGGVAVTAVTKIQPICGKVNTMKRHILRCEAFEASPSGYELRKRVLSRLESNENQAPLSRTPLGASPLTSAITERAAKRPCVSRSVDPLFKPDQAEFETDFLRVLCANNWSWHSAENPTTIDFFTKWIPYDVIVPERRKLSGPILDREVKRIEGNVQGLIKGQNGTGQCDGWKNIAKTPVITSIMIIDGAEYLICSHNMMGEPKTGDRLLQLVESDIAYMKQTYDITPIAWCTDDGPDGKKMRRLLKETYKWIMVIVCWGHQINLMVGDILGAKATVLDAISKALDIIHFFNDHSQPLAWLKEEQKITDGMVLILFLPCATRWLYNYLSVARFLLLKPAIKSCFVRREDQLVERGGTTEALRLKARHILQPIADVEFWNDLAIVKEILEPLTIANNVTQAADLRLDQVLITLGNLYRIYHSSQSLDKAIQDKILRSLEKRWKAADQDIYILAVFFNPYLRAGVFSSAALSPIDLFNIVEDVYKRVMQKEQGDLKFINDFYSYYYSRGDFSPESMMLDRLKEAWANENKPVDIMFIWQNLEKEGANFVKLAIRILSIVANSTACERMFSSFGITHTKLRNCLSLDKVHKVNVVRRDIINDHKKRGVHKSRLKRKLGEVDDDDYEQEEGMEVETNAVDVDSPRSVEDEAQALIHDARQADLPEDGLGEGEDEENDDESIPPVSAIAIPNPRPLPPLNHVPPPSSSRQSRSRRPRQTQILLQDLFIYTSDRLGIFWKCATLNLEKVVRIHEQQHKASEDAPRPSCEEVAAQRPLATSSSLPNLSASC